MPRQLQGSQTDFSFGEIDPSLKRADNHPARKAGLRQMANARLLNGGGLQNRSGRRALYPANSGVRTERFTIASGQDYDIQFSSGRVRIINSVGVTVGNFALQGSGAALPWVTVDDINSIVYAIFNSSIYICFGHSMRPQVISFNGVSTWSIADYTELVLGNQKRTPFYRISPQGIAILPAGRTGSIAVTATDNIFTAAHVGTRMRFVGRQMLITAVAGPMNATVTVLEALPGRQPLSFATDPSAEFSVGDIVIGSQTGSKGIVTFVSAAAIHVQLITTNSTSIAVSPLPAIGLGGEVQQTFAFVTNELLVGPAGSHVISAANPIADPNIAVSLWDEEVMNNYRGYPASVFVDQFRLGFCDFPALPGGIAWSSINSPTDLYVGANPADAMFELAPKKVRVFHVVPGPEGSEFVMCDKAMWYIPISATNPLKPGSVAFSLLSGDGCAQVQPRLAQEAILYVNAGQNDIMAVIATGAYNRPFNTKNLSELHGHLFENIKAIAAPSADDAAFSERYAYVLNGDGTIVVGKYTPDSLATNAPVIGWGPWSGAGVVSWVAAFGSDILFTSTYFGTGIVEVLDDSLYLDGTIFVNAAPAAFAPPLGKGPLWFIAGATVVLMDQVTRMMGTYDIDANGFIIPQNNGGEDLTAPSLVAGQQWTMTVEPFTPAAQSGVDVGQRMKLRQISNFAAYVMNSTGFYFAVLFSGKQTRTSPPLGTIQQYRRFPAWNQDDDPTLPPPLRETVEMTPIPGSSFDPRAAIIKDTPGPLLIAEIGMEVSL